MSDTERILESAKIGPFTPSPSGLLAHVDLCLSDRADRPPMEALEGLFGHAFESSYARGGAELWFACDLEWSHHGHGLRRISPAHETVEVIGKPMGDAPPPSPARWAEVLDLGWNLVTGAIGRGRPVLGWSLMSREQAEGGVGAFCWGVVYGFDASSREYLVRHRDSGLHRVRFDALGRVDAVNWVCLVALGELPRDWNEASRSAVRDAVRLLRGERTSASMPAPPATLVHGPEAMEVVADELDQGVCPVQRAAGLSRQWGRARRSGRAFCRWASSRLQGGADTLTRATALLDEQMGALEGAASGPETAAQLRRAAHLQRDLVEVLKRI